MRAFGPPHPNPLPPKRVEREKEGDIAGFSDHKEAFNLFHIIPSPQWGRGLG